LKVVGKDIKRKKREGGGEGRERKRRRQLEKQYRKDKIEETNQGE
jgi:hypothetical protein